MAENIRFKDLIAEGLAGAKTNTQFYLSCEKYRRADGWKKDGFHDWSECLAKLITKIRRSRSGVMAKLAQVRLLLDTKKVTFDQLEKIGDANATLLCRLYRVGKLNAAWIKRALSWNCEKFKAAVLKAVKPTEEPKRRLTFVLAQSVLIAVESLIGRVQTLTKVRTREGALEFITCFFLLTEDSQILETAGAEEMVIRLAKIAESEKEKEPRQRKERSNGSGSKATKSRRSKSGSRSPVSITKRAKKNSSHSESESMFTDSGTSSVASPDGESDWSKRVQEPITRDVN